MRACCVSGADEVEGDGPSVDGDDTVRLVPAVLALSDNVLHIH
jgi:hypothetical protein